MTEEEPVELNQISSKYSKITDDTYLSSVENAPAPRKPIPVLRYLVSTAFIWVGFFLLYLLFVLVGALADAPAVASKPTTIPKHEFSEARARQILYYLTDVIGARVCTTENNTRAKDYIVQQIAAIQQEATAAATSGKWNVEVFAEPIAARGPLQYHAEYYYNLTNVIVRISDAARPESKSNAILYSGHYDSMMSPMTGATDDGASIGIGLELLRNALHSEPSKHAIIFNFNNCEEVDVLGSSAFRDYHPWWQTVRAFINMDSGGIFGPKSILYRASGSSWLVYLYKQVAPHYKANSVAADLTRFAPGDSDFTIYKTKFSNMTGIDFSNMYGRNFDHTSRDIYANMIEGGIQFTGDNIGAVLFAASNSDQLPMTFAQDTSALDTIFVDVPGGMIVWSKLAFILTSILFILVISLLSLAWIACAAATVKYEKLKNFEHAQTYVKLACFSVPSAILSLLAAVGFPVLLGLIVQIINPLFWYRAESLAYIMYGATSLFGMLLFSIIGSCCELCVQRTEKEMWSFGSHVATLWVWTFVLLVAICIPNVGFTSIVFWCTMFQFISVLVRFALSFVLSRIFKNETFMEVVHHIILLCAMIFSIAMPTVLVVSTWRDFHIALLSKLATAPHLVIPAVVGILTCCMFYSALPYLRRGTCLTLLLVVVGFVCIVFFITACFIYPFDKTHPKRIYLQQTAEYNQTSNQFSNHVMNFISDDSYPLKTVMDTMSLITSRITCTKPSVCAYALINTEPLPNIADRPSFKIISSDILLNQPSTTLYNVTLEINNGNSIFQDVIFFLAKDQLIQSWNIDQSSAWAVPSRIAAPGIGAGIDGISAVQYVRYPRKMWTIQMTLASAQTASLSIFCRFKYTGLTTELSEYMGKLPEEHAVAVLHPTHQHITVLDTQKLK